MRKSWEMKNYNLKILKNIYVMKLIENNNALTLNEWLSLYF